MCTLTVKKKNQGRFRYVGSDHSLVSFSLGQYTTVFQAGVYAIKACSLKNVDRDYKSRNIYILLDSQAAIKALGKYKIIKNWSGIATNPHTSGRT
jgi:hypothetical protein